MSAKRTNNAEINLDVDHLVLRCSEDLTREIERASSAKKTRKKRVRKEKRK